MPLPQSVQTSPRLEHSSSRAHTLASMVNYPVRLPTFFRCNTNYCARFRAKRKDIPVAAMGVAWTSHEPLSARQLGCPCALGRMSAQVSSTGMRAAGPPVGGPVHDGQLAVAERCYQQAAGCGESLARRAAWRGALAWLSGAPRGNFQHSGSPLERGRDGAP